MTILREPGDLDRVFDASRNEAQAAFGDGTLYLEPYIAQARHVEVQILADGHGAVCHLGERDCSTQRRYQKLIEEAPAVGLPPALLTRMRGAAVDLFRHLGYVGAGTAEFLVDVTRDRFRFLEINARVQVEHPVTEMVTGIDIVREQLRIAQGRPLSFGQDDLVVSGHAIECRINAEDPARDFAPCPGTITRWVVPQATGLRVDTWVEAGTVVSPYYDSLVAKVVVHASDRAGAMDLMRRSLARTRIEGVATTVPVHRAVLADPACNEGPVTTRWLEESFLPSWNEVVP